MHSRKRLFHTTILQIGGVDANVRHIIGVVHCAVCNAVCSAIAGVIQHQAEVKLPRRLLLLCFPCPGGRVGTARQTGRTSYLWEWYTGCA